MKYPLSIILLFSLLSGQIGQNRYQLKKLMLPGNNMFYNKDNRTWVPDNRDYDYKYFILFDTFTGKMYRLSKQTYYDENKILIGSWYMKDEMIFTDDTDIEFQKALDKVDNKNKWETSLTIPSKRFPLLL